MNYVRQRIEARRSSMLYDLIAHTRHFEASDPRDKVYGILALVADADNPAFRVNYSQSVAEVSGRFTRGINQKYSTIRVPSQAGAQKTLQ
ncbi:hypothetical protein MMC06_002873, partial [Schaereria dolodes]|nr:hypothetical protein [Schaereria dolodes]